MKDAVKVDELAAQLLPLTPQLIAIAEATRSNAVDEPQHHVRALR